MAGIARASVLASDITVAAQGGGAGAIAPGAASEIDDGSKGYHDVDNASWSAKDVASSGGYFFRR